MTTHWIDGLEVTEYQRKKRPSSFSFLDKRAPGGRVSRSLLLGELLETRVRSELVKLAKKSQAGVLDPGAQSKDDDEVKNPSRAVAAVRPVSLSPDRSSTQAKHEQCPRVGASGELFTVAPSPHYP